MLAQFIGQVLKKKDFIGMYQWFYLSVCLFGADKITLQHRKSVVDPQ